MLIFAVAAPSEAGAVGSAGFGIGDADRDVAFDAAPVLAGGPEGGPVGMDAAAA